MNKFEIELLKRAYQIYEQTGNPESAYRARNPDDWFYNSEALKYLSEEGYIIVDEEFDFDENDIFAIGRPISYSLTNKGLDYVKENLKP